MAYRAHHRLSSRLRNALAPAVALSFLLYFGYHFVDGRYGLLALRSYQKALPELTAEATTLDSERARLERRIAGLNPRHIDPDLLDEMVRRRLGFVHPDDRVVTLPKS